MEVEDKLMLVGMVGEDRQMAVELSIGMVDNLLHQVGMQNREMVLGRPKVRKELHMLLGMQSTMELGVQVAFHMAVLMEESLMQVSAIVQYNYSAPIKNNDHELVQYHAIQIKTQSTVMQLKVTYSGIRIMQYQPHFSCISATKKSIHQQTKNLICGNKIGTAKSLVELKFN